MDFLQTFSDPDLCGFIGTNLKELRQNSGSSQLKLAIDCGISLRHYQDIEYGRRNIQLSTLTKILSHYKISIFSYFECIFYSSFHRRGYDGIRSLLSDEEFIYVVLDFSGRIKSINTGAEKIVQVQREDVVGEKIQNFFHNKEEIDFYRKFKNHFLEKSIKPFVWKGYIENGGNILLVKGTWNICNDLDIIEVFAINLSGVDNVQAHHLG